MKKDEPLSILNGPECLQILTKIVMNIRDAETLDDKRRESAFLNGVLLCLRDVYKLDAVQRKHLRNIADQAMNFSPLRHPDETKEERDAAREEIRNGICKIVFHR